MKNIFVLLLVLILNITGCASLMKGYVTEAFDKRAYQDNSNVSVIAFKSIATKETIKDDIFIVFFENNEMKFIELNAVDNLLYWGFKQEERLYLFNLKPTIYYIIDNPELLSQNFEKIKENAYSFNISSNKFNLIGTFEVSTHPNISISFDKSSNKSNEVSLNPILPSKKLISSKEMNPAIEKKFIDDHLEDKSKWKRFFRDSETNIVKLAK